MNKRFFQPAGFEVKSRPVWHGVALTAVLASLLITAGCSTRRVSQPAPVDDRTTSRTPALPGAENAGKPGYYTVRPGDTLYRVALESGQNWRDVQAWNNLSNANVLEVGQVLRVQPPVAAAPLTAPTTGGAVGTTTVAPLSSTSVVARPLTPGGSTATAAVPAPAAAAASEPDGADEVSFIWPAQGAVVVNFDETKNKGISISGRVGDPVLAAADGRVVYAGAGLRGYGNLIILKHNNTYLTAYAHNQALLVREDQAVRQGQKIAEMGSSDADRVKLHFEVRRLGKPVDPLKHLPGR
ncbi:peptidoglycan DD-metalloendopeptidase family protein [Hydrogenophaga sp.]|uniref:peptidoglycan DD-metalloendopeptidase family protein n=1 Tax=Hydrogenophaga sp. TaxID=1904254 RepID=UPI003568A376